MAFLTSDRSNGNSNVASALVKGDGAAIQVKIAATNVRTRALASNLRASDVFALLNTIQSSRTALEQAKSVPGIAPAYAEQYADVPGYDVGAEFTSMINAMNSVASWLEANYPRDADGNLKYLSFVGNGSGAVQSYSGYSAAELTAITAQMDSLLATID